GVSYFLVQAEIKNYHARSNGNGKENTAMVLKTLKPEERSIVNVLHPHGGTYLQKYITKEAGLSRLKTHKLVATLSERGIVQVEKHGKHEPGFAGKMAQWRALSTMSLDENYFELGGPWVA